jgi:hypothetical protein
VKLSGLIQPLIDAKAPHEQIMAVVLAFEAQQVDALEQRRKTDAERQARKREREASSRDVTLRHSDRSLMREPAHVEDKSLTSEIEHRKKEQEGSRASAFDAFWGLYPHKVGKADASKAFDRATKRVTVTALMAGLERYAAKTDDRPWCNPATWLNQDRWTDEPATAPPARASPRGNPALELTDALLEKLNAVHPSQTDPGPPYLSLVAPSGHR